MIYLYGRLGDGVPGRAARTAAGDVVCLAHDGGVIWWSFIRPSALALFHRETRTNRAAARGGRRGEINSR